MAKMKFHEALGKACDVRPGTNLTHGIESAMSGEMLLEQGDQNSLDSIVNEIEELLEKIRKCFSIRH